MPRDASAILPAARLRSALIERVAERANHRIADVAASIHLLHSLLGTSDASDDLAFAALADLDVGRLQPQQRWQAILGGRSLGGDFRACLDAVLSPYIPAAETVRALTDFARGSQIVVLGAGAAYWAYALDLVGANVAFARDSTTTAPAFPWTGADGGRCTPIPGTTACNRTTVLVGWTPGNDDPHALVTTGERLVVIGDGIDRSQKPCASLPMPIWPDLSAMALCYRW